MVQILKTFCDSCYEDDVETPIDPETQRTTLAINGVEKILDLCDAHSGPVKALQDLLEAQGRLPREVLPPTPKTAQKALETGEKTFPGGTTFRKGRRPEGGARPMVCLLCGLDYASVQSLRTHYGSLHGIENDNLVGIYGTRCPLCSANYPDSIGALSGHIRFHEAEDGTPFTLPQAFVWARDHDDPHGVYAAVKADLEQRRTDKVLA